MKKLYLLCILTIFVSGSFAATPKYPIKINHQFSYYSTSFIGNQNKGTFVLVFKITGMHSEKDALLVDDILKKRSYVKSVSTDFITGLCTVETDNIEYIDKIKESICSARRQIGNKITVEYIKGN